MGEVLGIDLGTTNTVVAATREGKVSALGDRTGLKLLPSVVSFHPNGSVLVGRPAKERRQIDARNTIYSIKRLIGRSWNSKEVRKGRKWFPFRLQEGPGNAPLVAARGETYTLPEISAFVLRKARQIAEEALGTTADRAVITVPANFNDLQRSATKVAGRVARLEVLRILNEPTAAALAYGYGRKQTQRLAVYDLGGGTFDITLLDLSGRLFQVLATAGNTFLGGDDIDAAVGDRIAESFLRQHRYDLRTDAEALERLRHAAESVKIHLSVEESVTLSLPHLAQGSEGEPVQFSFSFTRAELEALCAPVIDQSLKVCREALDIARMNSSQFDEVLLVGGSTRIPLVRQRVAELFGKDPAQHINPEEVVAMGAGLQAAALAAAERRRSIPAAARPSVPATQQTAAQGFGATRPGVAPPAADADDDLDDEPTAIHPRSALSSHPPPQPQPAAGQPPPPAQRSPAAPATRTGLGPRGQAPTHARLGPGSHPPAGMTATEAALRARVAAEEAQLSGAPPLPLVGSEDASQKPSEGRPAGLPVVGAGGLRQPGPSQSPMQQVPPALPLVGAGTLPGTAPSTRPPSKAPPPGSRPPPPPSQRAAPVGALTVRLGSGAAAQPAEIKPDEALSESSLPMPGVPPAPGATKPATPPPPPRAPAQRPSGTAPSPATTEGSVAAAIAAVAGSSGLPPSLEAAVPVRPPQQVLPAAQPAAPKLVDVTPLALCVETVGGFCDSIIERNTPLPCEGTRVFVTAVDNQTFVRVRVGQGASSRFAENTLLGELELSELRPAPRGQVQIRVAFALDTDGILNVSARDVATNRTASAKLRLEGLPEAAELEKMQARQAALATV